MPSKKRSKQQRLTEPKEKRVKTSQNALMDPPTDDNAIFSMSVARDRLSDIGYELHWHADSDGQSNSPETVTNFQLHFPTVSSRQKILLGMNAPCVFHGFAEVLCLSHASNLGQCQLNGSVLSYKAGWQPLYSPTTHAAPLIEPSLKKELNIDRAKLGEYLLWLKECQVFEEHKELLFACLEKSLQALSGFHWGLLFVRSLPDDSCGILHQISSFPQYACVWENKCPHREDTNSIGPTFHVHTCPAEKDLPSSAPPTPGTPHQQQVSRCFHFTVSPEMVVALDKSRELFKDNMSSPRILMCGSKDVGKSSLSRYLFNHWLTSDTSVIAFLDVDLGQPEFTPSGLVSLALLRKPRFGVPFTHHLDFTAGEDETSAPLQIISQCFVGALTPSDDPWFYMECVHRVYSRYLELPEPRPPLLVNTMGWVQGLGLRLLVDTIVATRPHLIIQMQGAHDSRNAPMALTKENLTKLQGLKCQNMSSVELHHETLVMTSVSSRTGRSSLGAAEHRNVVLLSHLLRQYRHAAVSLPLPGMRESPVVAPEESSTTTVHNACLARRQCEQVVQWLLSLQPVYRHWLCKPTTMDKSDKKDIPELVLRVMQWREDLTQTAESVLQVLNANLVALARIDGLQEEHLKWVPVNTGKNDKQQDDAPMVPVLKKNPVCECLGLAIVRAVEFNSTSILLLTSLSQEKLDTVNCILKGTPALPPCLFTEQPSGLPRFYVEEAQNVGIGRKAVPNERKFLKVRRHQHN